MTHPGLAHETLEERSSKNSKRRPSTTLSTLMALKQAQIEDPAVIAVYHDLVAAADWTRSDPRLIDLADRLADMFDAGDTQPDENHTGDFDLDDELAALLDEVFINALPTARHLLRLLEQRGWTGWTKLERTSTHAAAGD